MDILVAVPAAQRAVILVNHIEYGLHWLVVGYALGISAFYYAAYLIRH